MKNLAICLLFVAGLAGCVTTQYSKSVQITKDADGKIVKTVITETAIQPGRTGDAIDFEILKGVDD